MYHFFLLVDLLSLSFAAAAAAAAAAGGGAGGVPAVAAVDAAALAAAALAVAAAPPGCKGVDRYLPITVFRRAARCGSRSSMA